MASERQNVVVREILIEERDVRIGARDAAFGNTYPLLDDHRRVRSGRGEEFDRLSV
jgi:hypothetical protein